MTKSRFSAIPIALGFLLASSLMSGISSADDEDGVTTKSRIDVDKDDDAASISTTVRSGEKGDDDDTTVTKKTKKTVRGKDVDAEDVEEED
jgi:hypothetical protein